MIEIGLTNSEAVVVVDDADREAVAAYVWYEVKGTRTSYARTRTKRGWLAMHRLIMAARPGIEVDHRDGNGLNNQRANLRFATRAENCANARRRQDNTSGYKGVTRLGKGGRWHARIRVNGKLKSLGTFDAPEDAARAYNAAALTAHGPYARPNVVPATGDWEWLAANVGLDVEETQAVILHCAQGMARHEVEAALGITRRRLDAVLLAVQIKVQRYQEGVDRDEDEDDAHGSVVRSRYCRKEPIRPVH